MRNLKTILPMLAFVLAIGMSFAFVGATEDDFYGTGYIEIDNQWYQVDVDCETTAEFNCVAQIQGELKTYPVHTQPSENSPLLESPTIEPKMISDPR